MIDDKTRNRGSRCILHKNSTSYLLLLHSLPSPLSSSESRKVSVFWDVTTAGNLNPRDMVAFLFLQIYFSVMWIAAKTKRRGKNVF